MAQLGYNVTIEQLASMLGTSQDVKQICTSTNINKWSKRKPINHSQSSPLSDAQFKGMSTDISNGIIYGLKAGAAITSPENLHSATWDYEGRPQGGTSSWYRVDDFWGYEYEYTQGPTLTGVGLNDGDRVKYDSANKVVNLIWRTDLTSIVDLAEVIAAYQGTADYSKMYLCVMVGEYIRCCINNTIGGVYPIYYNGTQCTSFTIPEGQPYGYSESTARQVTLFFASSTDVDNLVPTMKSSWVNVFGLAFNQPLISCPNQVNKQIYFIRQVLQYISSFVVSVNKGMISYTIGKGNDWDSANAYRIAWSLSDLQGMNYPLTTYQYTDVPKSLDMLLGFTVAALMEDAMVISGNKQYNITGQMQYQISDVWQASEYSSTVTVTY